MGGPPPNFILYSSTQYFIYFIFLLYKIDLKLFCNKSHYLYNKPPAVVKYIIYNSNFPLPIHRGEPLAALCKNTLCNNVSCLLSKCEGAAHLKLSQVQFVAFIPL